MDKKQQFLLMAQQGMPKPEGNQGRLLRHYTSEMSDAFDAAFKEKIQNIAPHWLLSNRAQKTKMYKTALLKLAHQGAEKPNNKQISLRNALQRYTSKSSKLYDPELVRQLKIIAPHWLVNKTSQHPPSFYEQQKNELLKAAQTKGPRPSKSKSTYGKWIWKFTSPKSTHYDPQFTQKLMAQVPHWFKYLCHEEKTSNKIKKQSLLLQMAKEGQPRPKKDHELARSLRSYSDKNDSSYDPKFMEKIKKLAPHWIATPHELQRTKVKKQLLQLASSGAKKPSYRKNCLARRLSEFTSKLSRFYDREFTTIIQKLAPEWFVDDRQRTKQLLINMAKEGSPKPIVRRKTIGSDFFRWTNPRSPQFDPHLQKLLKSLRPDWFIPSHVLKKQELYQLAAQKAPRPHVKSVLGSSLRSYTQKSCNAYDKYFTKEIKKLAPQWFRK